MRINIFYIIYFYILWTPSALTFDYFYFEDRLIPNVNENFGEVACNGKNQGSKDNKDHSAQAIVKDMKATLRSIRESAEKILSDVTDLQAELSSDESQMTSLDKKPGEKDKDSKDKDKESKDKDKGKDKDLNKPKEKDKDVDKLKDKDKDKDKGKDKDADKFKNKEGDKDKDKNKDKDLDKDKDKDKDKDNKEKDKEKERDKDKEREKEKEDDRTHIHSDKAKVDGEFVITDAGFPNLQLNVSERLGTASTINVFPSDLLKSWDEQINTCKNLLETIKNSRSSSKLIDPIEKKLDDRIRLIKSVRSLQLPHRYRDPGPLGEQIQSTTLYDGSEKSRDNLISSWNEWLRV